MKGLPWGSGSGLARKHADPGYVFCVRVGDHPKPLFRYVGYRAEAGPVVIGDTLACLAHARPDEGTKTRECSPKLPMSAPMTPGRSHEGTC